MEKTIIAQPKWKSKYFWTGIASIVMMVMGQFGLYERLGITSDFLKAFLTSLFAFLSSLGVFNDSGNATEM